MTQDSGTRRTTLNRAYVLIQTEAQSTAEVAEALRHSFGIPMVDIVNGPYPVIAVVEGGNISTMAKTIAVDIRKLRGVRDIIVYMTTPEQEVAPENKK
jgi:hypothetical protein